MVNRLKIKMERQYFIITMHSLGQKVLITNSIKNKERNDMYSETCFINRYHGCFFAAVEIEQVNQVKMFARMFLRRSIEDMQQKS